MIDLLGVAQLAHHHTHLNQGFTAVYNGGRPKCHHRMVCLLPASWIWIRSHKHQWGCSIWNIKHSQSHLKVPIPSYNDTETHDLMSWCTSWGVAECKYTSPRQVSCSTFLLPSQLNGFSVWSCLVLTMLFSGCTAPIPEYFEFTYYRLNK